MDVTANKKSYIIHRSMGYGNLWLLGAELLGIKCMGAPRETSELKKVYDITSGSLLGENSSIDLICNCHPDRRRPEAAHYECHGEK